MSDENTGVSLPYRGPEEFRFADHEIFTQREQEVWEILQLISMYRGVVIYGQSGNGKSSLVNAGIIPEIIALGYTVDRVRIQPSPAGEFLVERISRHDEGTAPFLESGLLPGASGEKSKALTVDQFSKALNDGSSQKRKFLVFDQFEEIVTRFEEGSSTADMDRLAARARILTELERVLHSDSLPVKLLFLFRDDYLAPVRNLLSRCPEVFRQYYWLRAPGTEKTQAIIEGPLRLPHFQGKLDKLTGKIAAQLNSRARKGVINLTDLQIACLELWKAEKPGDLLDKRSVDGLIQDYLERALEPLKKSGLHEPAIALLGTMVTPRGTRNVISEYDALARVGPLFTVSDILLRQALHELIKTRLVRKFIEGDANYYEITSESLSGWINENRARQEVRIQRDKATRDVRNQSRKTFFALAFAAMVVLGLGLYFSTQASFHAAKQQLQTAQEEIQLLQQQKKEADRALQLLSSRMPAQKKGGRTLFGSDSLETAVGVIFLILLLGLVCSASNELIAMFMDSRARTLRKGLIKVLGDEKRVEKLYYHPLIKALTEDGSRPNYIPSRTFAMALLDDISPAQLSRTESQFLGELGSTLLAMPDSDLKRSLLLMASQSRSLNELYDHIESWFNDVMDAVAGWYRKRTQIQLLLLALLLAVAVNVDTLAIIATLSSSSATRAALTAAATNYEPSQQRAVLPAPEPNSAPSSSKPVLDFSELDARSRIPITWAGTTPDTRLPRGGKEVFERILGWLITALATAVCASFWFDFLNRFMVIRSTIKPYQPFPVAAERVAYPPFPVVPE